jgi:hypothetical protein
MLVPNTISLIVSTQDADYVSPNGDRFTINLADPLVIPRDAINIQLLVPEVTLYNDSSNIVTNVNDRFILTYLTVPYTYIYPESTYDFDTFKLYTEQLTLGFGLPVTAINFNYSAISKRVSVYSDVPNSILDFTIAGSIGPTLGFGLILINPVSNNPLLPTQAANIPLFNTINYYLVHSDLVNRGIRVNQNYTQTISNVLINAAPNDQIQYQPFNPPSTPVYELAGVSKDSMTFWVTDDQNRPIKTAEDWGLRVLITFDQPIVLRDKNGAIIG